MKNYAYLLMYLFFYSCKAQNGIDIKEADIIIFNFKQGNTHPVVDKFNTPLYHNNTLSIFKQRWQNYGTGYIDKYYYFLNDQKDTMSIKCNCGQEGNLYFKNFKFKKGYYELEFKGLPKERILGSQLQTPKQMQNMFYKNAYVPPDEPVQRDAYFKNLKFFEIDIEDTINVKLKKVVKEAFPKKELR